MRRFWASFKHWWTHGIELSRGASAKDIIDYAEGRRRLDERDHR